MNKVVYPLVLWRGQWWYGKVLDTGSWQTVAHLDANRRKLKTRLAEYIHRQWDDIWPPELVEPKLTVSDLETRPRLPSPGGSNARHVTANAVRFSIACVYGRDQYDQWTAYLPQFDTEFQYRNARQRLELTRYFASQALGDMTPHDRVWDLMMLGVPELDRLPVTVPTRDYLKRRVVECPHLERVAEPIAGATPGKISGRRKKGVADDVWGRSTLIDRAFESLIAGENLVLVGEPGVGKSTMLRRVAHRADLSRRRGRAAPPIWLTTVQRIVGAGKYLGEWQEHASHVTEELAKHSAALWIDDFLHLARPNPTPADSLGTFFERNVAAGSLQIIGELRPSELGALRLALPGLAGLLKPIWVPAMSSGELVDAVRQMAEAIERDRGISVGKDSQETAIRSARRHLRHESAPGNVMRLLRATIDEVRQARRADVQPADLVDSMSRSTGLPKLLIDEESPLDPQELFADLSTQVVGQDEAIARLVRAVCVYKSGLNDPNRPIATLLFAGPTGVGKTHAARTLARYVFGAGQTSDPLVRLDMSEFQGPSGIDRLMGTSDRPSKFVAELRRKPFSVVLFDEIEKAHPSFFNALLTVLDEGMLTDALGRTTWLRNAIIIMTSNIGARSTAPIGFVSGQDNHAAAVRQHFSPEFFNRIDQVVAFSPLGVDSMRYIAVLELKALAKRRGMSDHGLALSWDEAVVDWLIETGFDPRYGARPLRRAIEEAIAAPIARELLRSPDHIQRKVPTQVRLAVIDGAIAVSIQPQSTQSQGSQ